MLHAIPFLALAFGGQGSSQEPYRIVGRAVESRTVEQKLAFYEVQDLAAALFPDFEAPELGVPVVPRPRVQAVERGEGNLPGLDGAAVTPPTPQQVERGTQSLVQIVRTFIEPEFPGATEHVQATPSGTLIAHAPAAQQAWIERFLEGLRGTQGLIELEATIYTAPRGVLREWGLAPSATLATPEARQALRERVAGHGRFDVVDAPRILQQACQRVSIYVGDEVAYVKSYQVHIVEPGGVEIADPEVAVIRQGLALEARTSPLPGGQFGLELELQTCQVARPIPSRRVRIGASTNLEVEIGEPEVKTARFDATVALADGASVVLVTADTDPEKDLALVVTVRKAASAGPPGGK